MKKYFWLFAGLSLITVCNFFLLKLFSQKENPEQSITALQQPSVYSVQLPESLSFCGERVPLDHFMVREKLDRELTSNTFFHSSTILLLKRSNRWFPVIEPILSKYGIPDDFKYLALVESGLQHVVSPSGAEGIWQFLPKTAREYGLEVNSGIDERYHPEKATRAACQYLNDAYEKFANWTLAAAAYNTGINSIALSLSEQMADNYYDLFLNEETERYLFRILAIKIIFENPEKYGFHLDNDDLYLPVPCQTIKVTETIENLAEFALSKKVTYNELKYFNPWLRQNYLPNLSGRTYYLNIPLEGFTSYSKLLEMQQ